MRLTIRPKSIICPVAPHIIPRLPPRSNPPLYSIPALPYPPLEQGRDYHAPTPPQGGQAKSPVLLARPVLLTTKCPVLLTTAVRFCSHRDTSLGWDAGGP